MSLIGHCVVTPFDGINQYNLNLDALLRKNLVKQSHYRSEQPLRVPEG
jgi:hypothetical protein